MGVGGRDGKGIRGAAKEGRERWRKRELEVEGEKRNEMEENAGIGREGRHGENRKRKRRGEGREKIWKGRKGRKGERRGRKESGGRGNGLSLKRVKKRDCRVDHPPGSTSRRQASGTSPCHSTQTH